MAANTRRHERIKLRSPIRLSWQDRSGVAKFALAQTLDVSSAGVRVEIPEPVDRGTIVSIQSERLRFTSTGTVRSCSRQGGRFQVGIEFNGIVRLQRALEELTESVRPAPTPGHTVPR